MIEAIPDTLPIFIEVKKGQDVPLKEVCLPPVLARPLHKLKLFNPITELVIWKNPDV